MPDITTIEKVSKRTEKAITTTIAIGIAIGIAIKGEPNVSCCTL